MRESNHFWKSVSRGFKINKSQGSVCLLFLFFLSLLSGRVLAKEENRGAPEPTAGAPTSSVGVVVPLPNTPNIPKIPKTPNVIQVQKELQEIVEIQRSIQASHYQQLREIQRITEQARAHQQLLKNLSASYAPVKPTTGGVDTDEALRLEKIRLIQEQAVKNRKALEAVEKKMAEEVEKKKTTQKSIEKPF